MEFRGLGVEEKCPERETLGGRYIVNPLEGAGLVELWEAFCFMFCP